MPTAAIAQWSGQKLEAFYSPRLAQVVAIKLAPSTNFLRGTVLGEETGTNEIQTLQITYTAAPTGGTFTMTFGGQTTVAIPYNATALDVQQALEGLSTIGDGNVLCTGGPLVGTAKVRIEFRGALAAANQAQLTTTDSLTGGTAPATVVATVTGGATGNAGRFKPWDNDNTDGSEKPKGVLMFDCVTDSNSLITYSATGGQVGGLMGETYLSTPMYIAGYFKQADLVGFNVSVMEAIPAFARIVHGVLAADAVIRIN